VQENATNPETGLTAAEAEERLRGEGPNELPASGRRGVGAIAYGVLSEPMVFLLLASGGIYFLLGDKQEAIILLGFVVIVVAITPYQENKTERALEVVGGREPRGARSERTGSWGRFSVQRSRFRRRRRTSATAASARDAAAVPDRAPPPRSHPSCGSWRSVATPALLGSVPSMIS